MTRLILLPILLCCPLLSHAQTNTTKAASLVASSESSSTSPASLTSASRAISSADTAKAAPIVSQGVVPPRLVHTIPMKDDGNEHYHIAGRQRVVTVFLTVNEVGQPTDLHIPEPVDDALDVEVLATIGKFQYQPGMLDGKPIAMPIHMHYVVPVGAIY